MADDITNAELARRLDEMRRDVREDLADISRRQDTLVPREVYQSDKTGLDARITLLETRLRDSEDQRRGMTRWLISAVVLPAVALIVTIVLNLQGPT